MRVLVDDDGHHFRRRHRIDHELRRILVIRNDVDALAGDLVRYRLHARTTHTHARTDRIDAAVVALHRDLGAHARIASGTEDLDQALADFRHFELEQLDQELRGGARQEQLRTALLGAHVLQIRLHAVLRADRLARNHLVARNEAFGVAAEVHEHAVAIDALDDAGHQRALARLEFIDDLRPLGFAHLLHDDLLGGLGRDAAERDRFHRHFDVAADFGVFGKCLSRLPNAARCPGIPARWNRPANTFQRRHVS